MKIAQQEVIEVLEKSDKPLSRGQIAIILEADPIKVSHAIKRLLKYDEIKCIEVNRYEAQKLLKLEKPRRRLRLYYL